MGVSGNSSYTVCVASMSEVFKAIKAYEDEHIMKFVQSKMPKNLGLTGKIKFYMQCYDAYSKPQSYLKYIGSSMKVRRPVPQLHSIFDK